MRAFPDGDQRYPISTGEADEPVWARDGSELFYREGGRMMVVKVATEPQFVADSPSLVFDDVYVETRSGNTAANYDVSLDGERLLMVKDQGPGEHPTLVVVENFLDELQRLVPVD